MNMKLGRLRRISAAEADTDTRQRALDFMQRALELLDGEPGISPLVGCQLQLAIDKLVTSRSGDMRI